MIKRKKTAAKHEVKRERGKRTDWWIFRSRPAVLAIKDGNICSNQIPRRAMPTNIFSRRFLLTNLSKCNRLFDRGLRRTLLFTQSIVKITRRLNKVGSGVPNPQRIDTITDWFRVTYRTHHVTTCLRVPNWQTFHATPWSGMKKVMSLAVGLGMGKGSAPFVWTISRLTKFI